MFSKSFRVKSSTTLKASESKQLQLKVTKIFHQVLECDENVLFPSKEAVTANKVVTHFGNNATVYCVKNTPIIFEVEEILFPTVYMTWMLSGEPLPYFTTYPQVFTKLAKGADLMLPGIALPKDVPLNLLSYGNLKYGDQVSIILTSNKAVVAIGQVVMSSNDMYFSAHGKAVKIVHVAGDYLCNYWNKMEIPNLGPPTEEQKQLCSKPQENASYVEPISKPICPSELAAMLGDVTLDDETALLRLKEEDPLYFMDQLTEYVFLKVLKTHAIICPILSSSFYRQYMLPACPSNYILDIKKTSYKKLSKFLEYMARDNVIWVKQLVKGVESIMSVNLGHEKVSNFRVEEDKSLLLKSAMGTTRSLSMYDGEQYTVTPVVFPLFCQFGFKKGDSLRVLDVQKYVGLYVQRNKLSNGIDSDIVMLDSVLRGILKYPPTVKEVDMLDLLSVVMDFTRYHFAAHLPTGKNEPIDIQVANRSGNKKVTLVYNLECYGVDLKEFSRKCQQVGAASSSISTVQHHKGKQLLIQGNQVYQVGKLLQDDYKIPARFIRGLEKAIKPK